MNRKQFVLVIASFAIVIALIFSSSFLRGSDEDDKVKVVATFYPLAYMAESIGGERVIATSLVPFNSELHSWQPAPQDIIRADDADVILYNGGPADAWLVSNVLPSIGNDDRLVVNTTVGVTYISGGDNGDGGVDPHTWLSPLRAMAQARNVFDALCQADPDGIGYFTQRFATLNQSLSMLDQQYGLLAGSSVPGIIVSHSAFGYVARDYGFEQYGAIGLSADEDPSGSDLIELADLMEEEGMYFVYVDPVYNQDYGNILKSDLESRTGHEVMVLDIFLGLGPYHEYDYLGQLSKNLMSFKAGLGVD
ncbi:MAG: zinc ABC transporter substrate-binding protein [Euryarchaeota archaeon]|nr:zinc ABC transporter substrate-binding protein [Euryarchaeota archaeon]